MRHPTPADEICPNSKRVPYSKAHSFLFDGDDPYVVCSWCGQRRGTTHGMIYEDTPIPRARGAYEYMHPESTVKEAPDATEALASLLAYTIVHSEAGHYEPVYQDTLKKLVAFREAILASERNDLTEWAMATLAYYPEAQKALLAYLSGK